MDRVTHGGADPVRHGRSLRAGRKDLHCPRYSGRPSFRSPRYDRAPRVARWAADRLTRYRPEAQRQSGCNEVGWSKIGRAYAGGSRLHRHRGSRVHSLVYVRHGVCGSFGGAMKNGKGIRLFIQEVAPRDGFQIESLFVPTEKKIELINALSRTGLAKIEATSFTSPKAIPSLADAEQVMRGIARVPGVEYSVLVPNVRGAERA